MRLIHIGDASIVASHGPTVSQHVVSVIEASKADLGKEGQSHGCIEERAEDS